MTRTYTLPAPSYFEHAARLTPQGPVIVGAHLDVDPLDSTGVPDPLRMARRFAHVMAQATGEPFAWGWYDSPAGGRPAVCAAELAGARLRVHGRTDRLTGNVA